MKFSGSSSAYLKSGFFCLMCLLFQRHLPANGADLINRAECIERCQQQDVGPIELKATATQFIDLGFFGLAAKFLDTNGNALRPARARVASTDPLILEELPRAITAYDKPCELAKYSDFRDSYKVSKTLVGTLAQLKYGDLIECTFGPYAEATPKSGNVAICQSAGREVLQKITKAKDDYSVPKLMIVYFCGDPAHAEKICVYSDGRIIYYGYSGDSLCLTSQITREQLRTLLSKFAEVRFDQIPADQQLESPYLILNCNRYQPVCMSRCRANLKPITSQLDSIKRSLLAHKSKN